MHIYGDKDDGQSNRGTAVYSQQFRRLAWAKKRSEIFSVIFLFYFLKYKLFIN